MLDKLVGQTYDMLLVFWGVTNVRPAEMYDQLSIEADVPGAGFNTGSWQNAEFDDLMQQARTLEGCDEAERKALYDRAQEIVHAEIPRYYVSTSLVPIVVQNAVVDFAPRRNSVFWNQPAWSIQR
jgi:peptide/nickel transport system substrate-binding protein